MLRIIRGARLDRLLDAMLASISARPLPPPTQEIVVIQGRGLDRWISQQAALRQGGWGFVETLFPRPFLMRAFAAVLDGAVPTQLADDGVMGLELQLRVAALLPGLLDDARFATVKNAVMRSGTPPVEAALAMAPRIAEVLDRCAQHRVERVVAWTKEERPKDEMPDEPWLAELWRRVTAEAAPSRLIVDRERFLRACAEGRGPLSGLPERLSIFGVSTLAPAFVEILEALGRRMETTVYALDPCHGPSVHAMARHWGAESIEFAALMEERGRAGGAVLVPVADGPPAAERPGGLAALQARMRGEPSSSEAKLEGAGRDGAGSETEVCVADDTLALHSCRGALHEVETAHDAIVALLRNDASLEPRDIAILTPSLEQYGPMVEAVFESRRDERDRIVVPFAVADRDRATAQVVEAFVSVLELALSRCERKRVLEALAQDSIRGTFALNAADLETIEQWCEAAQIRWGLDADHRGAHGRRAETIGTWQWGIDRLHLGAVVAEGTIGALGADEPIAPVFAVEGSGIERVMALQSFLDALRPLAMGTDAVRPLAQAMEGAPQPAMIAVSAASDAPRTGDGTSRTEDWISIVESVAQRVLARDADHEAGATVVRSKLAALRAAALAGGFHGPDHAIGVRAAVTFIAEQLRDTHPGRGLLASGVTVAALQPMRSIPFRVIVLVGMADGAIPRALSHASFDLVTIAPRRGDRTPRLDDRQVMLETIFAASRALLITWPGIDPSNGHDAPASVLVEELREVMCGFDLAVRRAALNGVDAPTDAASDAVVRAAAGAADGAAITVTASDAAGEEQRAEPAPVEHAMTLDELERFWRSPAEGHLRAIGVGTQWRGKESPEEDPIGVEFAPELRRAMMPLDLESGEGALQMQDTPTTVLTGSGWLPRGPAAARVQRSEREMLREWLAEVDEIARGAGAMPDLRGALTRLAVDLEVTIDPALAGLTTGVEQSQLNDRLGITVRLTGSVVALRGVGPLLVVESDVADPRTRMRAWIRLLAARAAQRVTGQDASPSRVLVINRKPRGRGDDRASKPEARLIACESVDEARERLGELVALAWRARREPIAFMPATSMEYAHHCEKDTPEPASALEKARSFFAGPQSDRRDASVCALFGPNRFFDARSAADPCSFVALAERIARPLVRTWKDGLTGTKIRKPGMRSAARDDDGADAPPPRRRKKGA